MLRNILKTYIGNESGNFSIMMSVGVGVLLLMIGSAVDFMNGTQAQQRLQSVADRALLDAVISGESDIAELQARVDVSLAEFSPSAKGRIEFFGQNNENVRIITSDTEPLLIMGTFGFDDLDISAVAESVIPTGGFKLNLAMALDTTLSMSGTRIASLRTAATDLVNTLEASAVNPGDIQISMVPFSDYVRIDTSNRGAPWLELQPETPYSYQALDLANSVGCVTSTGENAFTTCTTPVFQTLTAVAQWEGCMASRINNDHLRAEYAGRPLQGPSKQLNCNGGYNILAPLTDNFAQIRQSIQSLNTIGDTFIPAGLAWAWRTLDPRLPFDESKFSNPQETRNVLLLMTDGTNSVTLNGTSPDFNGIFHWANSDPIQQANDKTRSDDYTRQLCQSIKDNGIEIITIAYEVTDNDTLDLLRDCASGPTDFINATSSSRLLQAFADIGQGLQEDIRLTR